MDKQQAQEIIRETFENPFDKDRFARFIRDLLNKINEAPFTYKRIFNCRTGCKATWIV